MIAILKDDIVVSVLEGEPLKFIHPSLSQIIVDISSDVEVGDYYDGKTFHKKPVNPDFTIPEVDAFLSKMGDTPLTWALLESIGVE
jgi:hypothetical protein